MSDAERGGAARRLTQPVLLQAAVSLFAVEAVRASGPLLDHVAGAHGVPTAAVVALVVYLAPALVAPAARWLGTAHATTAFVVLLVLARLVAQIQHTPGFVVGMVTGAAALGSLVLVTDQLARPGATSSGRPAGTGVAVAVGIALGGAVDVAVRAAFGTWDPIWQPGLLPWLYTILACLALLVLRARNRDRAGTPAGPRDVARLGLLGLYLALYVLVLGSPAFVASQGAVGLPYAEVILLVGALLGIEVASRLSVPGGSGRLSSLSGRLGGGVAGGLLALAVLAALLGHGLLVVPAVLVGQVAAVAVLARVFTRPAPAGTPAPSGTAAAPATAASAGTPGTAADRPGGYGYLLAGLGVGLCFVLVVLLYQMTYELPLPFDNRALPVLAAVLLGLAGMGVRPGPTPADTEPTPRPGAHEPNAEERDEKRAHRGRFAPLAGVPAVLLLVPVLMLVTSPSPAPAGTSGDAVRLVTWNLHYGVNNAAAVDPATISGVLRAQHPDVILLQEVDRGWAIGGGTDLVEWLSRSLAMPYVWSPAADGQFGNVILSSLPMSDVRAGQLPYGAGPQHRSYASAKVELASGQKLRVMTAHLQDHTDNHATRLAEINTLLRHWGHDNPAVIAGDFNAMPGWSEIRRFDRAGLVSAQDAGGNGGMLTSPTDRPRYRPDWIFGTDDVSFRDFARPKTQASDHFPLVVTVDLG